MKRMICLFSLLTVLFLCGCLPAFQTSPTTGVPTQTTDTLQPFPSTSSTTAAPPEEATQPSATESISNDKAYIGALYTYSQLESMDNEMHSFGSGRFYTTKRPTYSVTAQKEYAVFDASFIAEDAPTVYLTFDCGYEYENITADILDTLKEKHVQAVFFVTMHYCKSQPQLVQRMIEEGHIVGNHSNSHRYLPTLDIEEMAYEITSLHEYVKDHFQYEMTLFRPPNGLYSTRTLALTQSLGYRSVFWSFAYCDWDTEKQPNAEDAFDTVTRCAHNGCIYLLHSVSATNAKILGDVIDNLRQRGYTIELFQ